MTAHGVEKTLCTACGKEFADHMGLCPFCGQLRESAEPEPVEETPVGLTEDTRAAVTQAFVESTPTPEAAESAAEEIAHTCAHCGAEDQPLQVVRVEAWEDMGYTLGGKRKYRVHRIDASCTCAACMKNLHKQRFKGDLLTVAPYTVLVIGASLGTGSGNLSVIIGLFYFFYLIRWGFYTWADKFIYGMELETTLRFWLPSNAGKIKFPVGWMHGLLRFALVPASLILGVILASFMR